ncbi:probable mitochondrial-processing peptidase subunit alpha-1, mitochondrial isoform X2 [Capsicum annuum]|uniref:probable mitochondrial-processing peptidase subunit alpha-1, mitochondrial isoform X2 n=1 Tax=Capsicum annuum TaxID=4072 RepID=UPI001FB080CE|nr:probable mitochondrial-processing peptidase subunit alpha-1, mitochondrial isoform X2 [Capsicum annuum]
MNPIQMPSPLSITCSRHCFSPHVAFFICCLASAFSGQILWRIVLRAWRIHSRQATKFAILMNLEYRMVASEDIGRQLLTYGERLINYFSPVMQIENALASSVDGESPCKYLVSFHIRFLWS